jgi:glycosyltransferase involved in cell wall biosynthesis
MQDSMIAALANASAVVTLTETDRTAYRDRLGPDGPRVVAIPKAVPDVPLGPADPGAHRLLAAGRLESQKGFDMLLEAFAALVPVHPDWSLDIFGKGTQGTSLERQIVDLGIGERAHINSPTDRLGERMRDASVYVLSSRFEGFPIVLLEALAAGLAVVAFDCPTGPGEILDDSTTGLLVSAEDVSALTAALARVMVDESLRRRLSAAAPGAVGPYSRDAVGRRWDELLAPGSAGGSSRVAATSVP